MFDLLWLAAFVGAPVAMSKYHWPIFYLLAVSLAMGLIPTRVNIGRFNLFATQWSNGRRVASVMYVFIFPALFNSALMTAFYGIARLLWR